MTGKDAVKAPACLLAMTLGLLAAAPVRSDDKTGAALAALERKLQGAWVGSGPCDGQLTIRPDGTYARRLHGPGGNNSAGTWRLRWDTLPPTLALSCRTSDDPAYASRTLEVKVVRLDDARLVLQYQEQTPARYTRGEEKPDARAGGEAQSTTKDELVGRWRCIEVTLVDGQTDLELKLDGRFVYEHLDVSLGWRTTILGTWELQGGRVVLMAQRRLHDGMEVDVGQKKTEELSATRRDEGWVLSGPKGPQLRKAMPSKS
jgi:hypothetical protein